ncbi:MAG: M48 family metallopeptidase [Magnetococcales bacterium]|nr:M48 family metallopeptidase [Magnetococcales bacterium]
MENGLADGNGGAVGAGQSLCAGDWLPYLDGRLQLLCSGDQLKPIVVRGQRLWIAERHCRATAWQPLLEQWFRRQAALYLPIRLSAWSARMGVDFQRLTIRNPRRRWGSCSVQGSINLNWRLIWLPVRLGDYVLVHELSHLRHMDHSPAFWQLVANYVPDYRECRRQLRQIVLPW